MSKEWIAIYTYLKSLTCQWMCSISESRCEFLWSPFQELQTERDSTESLTTQLNNDVSSLSADHVFTDVDDITQPLTLVNSKWENLRSRIASTESMFQLLAESYPTFTGEFLTFVVDDLQNSLVFMFQGRSVNIYEVLLCRHFSLSDDSCPGLADLIFAIDCVKWPCNIFVTVSL